MTEHLHPCPDCNGTGCLHIEDYMMDEPCENCSGEGTYPDWEE